MAGCSDLFEEPAEATPATPVNTGETSTLSKIFNVEPQLMQTKFGLEPRHRCSPEEGDNLMFVSPKLLLEDRDLRQGGFKDRGAKDVLGLVAKDISQSKDHSLFQVPEITYFHMGYGKRSGNKKHRMAITKQEAQNWMENYDLAAWKARKELAGNKDDAEREGESPMDLDDELILDKITFPKQNDHQALDEFNNEDDLIDPSYSGLKIRVKSRYLLFFSILLIFFKKKLEKQVSKKKSEEEVPKRSVAENKISDFLLFWTVPYLLNFTQQQVNIVNDHHKMESKAKGEPQFSVPVVSWSAIDIIRDAFESCKVPEILQEKLLAKYRLFYGTDQLERKYNLPRVLPGNKEPLILVPLHHQERKLSLRLEEMGRRWKDIGKVTLANQFIEAFVANREIQEDFLHSIREQEEIESYAVDYAILLPDLDTFTELINSAEGKQPDIFFKVVEPQGRDFVAPRLGFLKHSKETISVCFSYFQGKSGGKVSTVFRATGSYRPNHFTVAVLHGVSAKLNDPECKLMSLYPVQSATKYTFHDGKQEICKVEGKQKISFSEGKGCFCKIEFPGTFGSFEQEVCSETVVRELISKSKGKLKHPTYYHGCPLKVCYRKARSKSRKRFRIKSPQNAANLEGCLLQHISAHGRKGSVAVILAVNDYLEKKSQEGALEVLFGNISSVSQEDMEKKMEIMMRKTISHFVRALVIAGLPRVYPVKLSAGLSVPGEEDSSDDESSSQEEEDEKDNDDKMDATTSGASGEVSSSTRGGVPNKLPSRHELEMLSKRIGYNWESLAFRLGFHEGDVTGFDRNNPLFADKIRDMLFKWKQRDGSDATYLVLCEALRDQLVGYGELAQHLASGHFAEVHGKM